MRMLPVTGFNDDPAVFQHTISNINQLKAVIVFRYRNTAVYAPGTIGVIPKDASNVIPAGAGAADFCTFGFVIGFVVAFGVDLDNRDCSLLLPPSYPTVLMPPGYLSFSVLRKITVQIYSIFMADKNALRKIRSRRISCLRKPF